MAWAKSKSKHKSVKRNDANIWMVAQLASIVHITKLPSKKEALTSFFLYEEAKRKAVHDASHCATEDITKVWAKASIPTCPKKHVVK